MYWISITIFVFSILALYMLLSPVFTKHGQTANDNDDTENLQNNIVETTKAAIQDLEYEFQIGKISEVDYKSIKNDLLLEWKAAEKDLPPSRKESSKVIAIKQFHCEFCSATIPNPEDAQFCSKCGKPWNQAYV